MTVEPKGAGVTRHSDLAHFTTDHLYLQLFSLRGCSVKVTVRFPKGKIDDHLLTYVRGGRKREQGEQKDRPLECCQQQENAVTAALRDSV